MCSTAHVGCEAHPQEELAHAPAALTPGAGEELLGPQGIGAEAAQGTDRDVRRTQIRQPGLAGAEHIAAAQANRLSITFHDNKTRWL